MLVVQVWSNCIIVLTICDSFSGWSWCTASKMVKNGVLSVCSSCRRPQPLLYLYVVFSMPWLRCLPIQGWARVIWSLPTKLVAVWTRILLTSFISNVSWVVANVMIWVFPLLQEMQQKIRKQSLVQWFDQNFADSHTLISTHHQKLMKSVGVMAANNC
jgi:hypothetical protein